MSVEDHFIGLVDTLPPQTREIYNRCRAVRIETAFRSRHFIIYKLRGKDPVELDRVSFEGFECDDFGATTTIRSIETSLQITIGYTPVQVFDYPIFMFIPLHAKIRWATVSAGAGGSLAYPIGIRTQSRRGLREKGVVHCETGLVYGKEFDFAIRA